MLHPTQEFYIFIFEVNNSMCVQAIYIQKTWLNEIHNITNSNIKFSNKR